MLDGGSYQHLPTVPYQGHAPAAGEGISGLVIRQRLLIRHSWIRRPSAVACCPAQITQGYRHSLIRSRSHACPLGVAWPAQFALASNLLTSEAGMTVAAPLCPSTAVRRRRITAASPPCNMRLFLMKLAHRPLIPTWLRSCSVHCICCSLPLCMWLSKTRHCATSRTASRIQPPRAG